MTKSPPAGKELMLTSLHVFRASGTKIVSQVSSGIILTFFQAIKLPEV